MVFLVVPKRVLQWGLDASFWNLRCNNCGNGARHLLKVVLNPGTTLPTWAALALMVPLVPDAGVRGLPRPLLLREDQRPDRKNI
jgi:hypothetical protein